MKKNKRESIVLSGILSKVAPTIGATVISDPEYGIASQITFKSGRRTYVRYNTLDLNPVGASDIAKDKDYSNFFMGSMGYPIVPHSKTFFQKTGLKRLALLGILIRLTCMLPRLVFLWL